jgi:hypothetical protein
MPTFCFYVLSFSQPSYHPTKIIKAKTQDKSEENKVVHKHLCFIAFLISFKYIQGLLSLPFFYSIIDINY